jgi:hypothetical protein
VTSSAPVSGAARAGPLLSDRADSKRYACATTVLGDVRPGSAKAQAATFGRPVSCIRRLEHLANRLRTFVVEPGAEK